MVPAVALFEFSYPLLVRSREGPLFVAEEFALHKALGHGGAVDRQERLPGPAAVLVDRPRHQLLSGAAFSDDQHVHILGRHAADGLAHRLNRGA